MWAQDAGHGHGPGSQDQGTQAQAELKGIPERVGGQSWGGLLEGLTVHPDLVAQLDKGKHVDFLQATQSP